MRISPTAIVMLLLFALLLFGSKRLPDAARSLGRSWRILKSEAAGGRSDRPARQPEVTAARTIQAAPGAPVASRRVEDRD